MKVASVGDYGAHSEREREETLSHSGKYGFAVELGEVRFEIELKPCSGSRKCDGTNNEYYEYDKKSGHENFAALFYTAADTLEYNSADNRHYENVV